MVFGFVLFEFLFKGSSEFIPVLFNPMVSFAFWRMRLPELLFFLLISQKAGRPLYTIISYEVHFAVIHVKVFARLININMLIKMDIHQINERFEPPLQVSS